MLAELAHEALLVGSCQQVALPLAVELAAGREVRECEHGRLRSVVGGSALGAGLRSSAESSRSGPKIEPLVGRRQRPAARSGVGYVCGGLLAGDGQGRAGVGGQGFEGDFVAEAFQALEVVAGLAAGTGALVVVAGAEVVVAGGGVGEQGVVDGQDGVAGGDEGFAFGHALVQPPVFRAEEESVRPAPMLASPRAADR